MTFCFAYMLGHPGLLGLDKFVFLTLCKSVRITDLHKQDHIFNPRCRIFKCMFSAERYTCSHSAHLTTDDSH